MTARVLPFVGARVRSSRANADASAEVVDLDRARRAATSARWEAERGDMVELVGMLAGASDALRSRVRLMLIAHGADPERL